MAAANPATLVATFVESDELHLSRVTLVLRVRAGRMMYHTMSFLNAFHTVRLFLTFRPCDTRLMRFGQPAD